MLPLVLVAGLALPPAAASEPRPAQRLLLVGGDERPAEALRLFVEWAGGRSARLLVVPWGSEDPEGSFAALSDEFLARLASATGVFFAGGDQSRIMDALADAELAETFRGRHRAGTPLGGASAGTALAVEGRTARVLGASSVLAVSAAGPGDLALEVLAPGQRFDLGLRRRLR